MPIFSNNLDTNGQNASLFPQMVDRLADSSPDTVYGQWAMILTSYEAGYLTITYAQLANIVNGLAWWLVEEIGPVNPASRWLMLDPTMCAPRR
jgi:hypothetical protein